MTIALITILLVLSLLLWHIYGELRAERAHYARMLAAKDRDIAALNTTVDLLRSGARGQG